MSASACLRVTKRRAWHAAVAKLSFLITGPPHARASAKWRRDAGLDRGAGFLGGL